MGEPWGPRRVRVFPDRMRENPWFRTGAVWRDHKVFLAQFEGAFDRQEEDEDFEILAPPRPTLRGGDRETYTFEDGQAGSHVSFGTVEDCLALWQRGRGDHLHRRNHTRMKEIWEVRLEDNYDALMVFDKLLVRQEGHWYARYVHATDGIRRTPFSVKVVDHDGEKHGISALKAAWCLETGYVGALDTFANKCGIRYCYAPDHHKRRAH